MGTNIRCFDYVNHPYQKVCEILKSNASEVFHDATSSAQSRAESVTSGLHVNVGAIEFSKEVLIDVQGHVEEEQPRQRKTTIQLEWKAADTPQLFPVMKANLNIYPITGKETQLDFEGEYDPPLGIIGKAIDALVGHRIAEASVHHFVSEVAEYLRKNLN